MHRLATIFIDKERDESAYNCYADKKGEYEFGNGLVNRAHDFILTDKSDQELAKYSKLSDIHGRPDELLERVFVA